MRGLLLLSLCIAGGRGLDDEPASPADRWVVIVVGLPGDEEHEDRFRQVLDDWTRWLTQQQGIPPGRLRVHAALPPLPGDEPLAATRDAIEQQFAALREQIQADDELWLFLLGHGNYDEEHAFLHLPGPDLHEGDLAAWLADLPGRQVLFLTQSCSGWMLKPLSRPGRIVITATAADREANETEFPEALAEVVRGDPARLDLDGDGRPSLAELFGRIVEAVDQRFRADMRAATEHAQLDDNGDGRGTELAELSPRPGAPPADDDEQPETAEVAGVARPDGQSAARVWLRPVGTGHEESNPR